MDKYWPLLSRSPCIQMALFGIPFMAPNQFSRREALLCPPTPLPFPPPWLSLCVPSSARCVISPRRKRFLNRLSSYYKSVDDSLMWYIIKKSFSYDGLVTRRRQQTTVLPPHSLAQRGIAAWGYRGVTPKCSPSEGGWNQREHRQSFAFEAILFSTIFSLAVSLTHRPRLAYKRTRILHWHLWTTILTWRSVRG